MTSALHMGGGVEGRGGWINAERAIGYLTRYRKGSLMQRGRV